MKNLRIIIGKMKLQSRSLEIFPISTHSFLNQPHLGSLLNCFFTIRVTRQNCVFNQYGEVIIPLGHVGPLFFRLPACKVRLLLDANLGKHFVLF